jgi:hypothetical protein
MEETEKIEVGVETPEQVKKETIEDSIEKWYKSVSEKPIKDVLKSIGDIKFKYFLYVAAAPFALILGGFMLHIFIEYVIIWLLWGTLSYDFSMATGANVEYEVYKFFDSDLWRTIPLCLVISIIVANDTSFKNRFLMGLFYFVFLVASLECWNFLHLTSYIDEIWGGTYFVIFFALIPILIAIKGNKKT